MHCCFPSSLTHVHFILFSSFPLKCKHPNHVSKDIIAESYFWVLGCFCLGELNSFREYLESLPGTTCEVSTEFNHVFNRPTHLTVNSTGRHSNNTVTLKGDDEIFFLCQTDLKREKWMIQLTFYSAIHSCVTCLLSTAGVNVIRISPDNYYWGQGEKKRHDSS